MADEDKIKILIVKMSSIGDVIHTLPALNALRRRFPDAHVTWLVEKPAADVVLGHQAVDRVIVSDRRHWLKGLLSSEWLGNLRRITGFTKALRDTSYDIVIDFQGLMKSAVMVGLSKGKRKVGYNKTREYSYVVLNERVDPYDLDKHAVFRYLNLLKALNVDTDVIEFGVPFEEEDKRKALSLLREQGWTGQPVVSMNPVAKWKTKLWAAGRFSDLADRLIEGHGCFVVFTGDNKDRREVADILPGMSHKCGDLTGQTNLRQLAALYDMSSCVVTTDTGPMHLAAAIGAPVVALFGPTAPWRTGPFGEHHEVVRADLACSPCFKRRCDTVECMTHVKVGQVHDAVTRVLNRSSGRDIGGTQQRRGT